MNCDEARRLIQTELDGESGGEAEGHLARCGPCRRWVAEMRALDADLRRELSSGAAPRGLTEHVAAQVAADRGRPVPVWRWAIGAACLAGIAAIVLVAVLGREPATVRPRGPSVIAGAENVHVFRPASTVARAATMGEVLEPGSTAWSLGGAAVRLGFEDGGSVRLGSEAVVQFAPGAIVLHRGRIEVAMWPGQSLVVHTPVTSIEVSGGKTAIVLEPTGAFAEINVLSGRAVVRDGERAEVVAGDPPLIIGASRPRTGGADVL